MTSGTEWSWHGTYLGCSSKTNTHATSNFRGGHQVQPPPSEAFLVVSGLLLLYLSVPQMEPQGQTSQDFSYWPHYLFHTVGPLGGGGLTSPWWWEALGRQQLSSGCFSFSSTAAVVAHVVMAERVTPKDFGEPGDTKNQKAAESSQQVWTAWRGCWAVLEAVGLRFQRPLAKQKSFQ